MKSVISLVGLVLFALAGLGTGVSTADAQTVPDDYQQVLKITGKSGDYKANVLKVNIPRNDIHVTIDNLCCADAVRFWRMVCDDQGRQR